MLIEEFLEGEELSLLSIVVRAADPAAGACAGLQACAGRRRGAEHGWHGLLLAGAGGGCRAVRGAGGHRRQTHGGRTGAPGHRLPGRPLHGPHADQERAEGARVQLPFRRSGDPGPAPAARERPARTAVDRCHRRRVTRRGGLAARRRCRRGHGFAGLPGLVVQGGRHHRSGARCGRPITCRCSTRPPRPPTRGSSPPAGGC